ETGLLAVGPETLAPPSAGWQHVGERWYDPALGRFLQRDPIGIRGGLNRYTFVGSSPQQLIDPSGQAIDPVSLIVSTTIVMGITAWHIYQTQHDADNLERCGEQTFIERRIGEYRPGKPPNKPFVFTCSRATNPKARYRVVVARGPNNTVSITVMDLSTGGTSQWYWKDMRWH
ncbi:MAG: RHS repeat-associated core domain-containing protein, partial [Phycisphaerae bacterium]|nr:RHS repeat-associated core domain-containing protein [Phycisphaerae bacterium]